MSVLQKSTGENETKELHVLPIRLRKKGNNTGGAKNVLPGLQTQLKYQIPVCFSKADIFRGYFLVSKKRN